MLFSIVFPVKKLDRGMIHTVAVLSRAGRLLIARQYTHENRSQIEGHLGAFPKLIATSGHAYIDAESVRFVYQEIGELYIVLVVSKDSNIVEDLAAVSLLTDVTGQVASKFDEEAVLSHGLDLVFAYDECVFDGFRQNVTAADVGMFLKMESREEKEADWIRMKKEVRAASEMRMKMQKLSEERRGGASGVTGLIKTLTGQVTSVGNTEVTAAPTSPVVEVERPAPRPTRPARGGMDLTRTSRTRAEQVMAEEGLSEAVSRPARTKPVEVAPGLRVLLMEKFTAVMSRLGAVKEVAVEGRLVAAAGKPAHVHIQTAGDVKQGKYRFKLMQQPRGSLWQTEKKLEFDNTSGKYGANAEVTLLCWRMTSTDEDDLPITVGCWVPQQTQTASTFSIEVELKKEGFKCDATEIVVQINGPDVDVSHCDGSTEVYARDGYLKWTLEPLDDQNPRAELEFTVKACEEDSFFPVTVSFESPTTICDIDVTDIIPLDDEDAPELTVTRRCQTSRFEIE